MPPGQQVLIDASASCQASSPLIHPCLQPSFQGSSASSRFFSSRPLVMFFFCFGWSPLFIALHGGEDPVMFDRTGASYYRRDAARDSPSLLLDGIGRCPLPLEKEDRKVKTYKRKIVLDINIPRSFPFSFSCLRVCWRSKQAWLAWGELPGS